MPSGKEILIKKIFDFSLNEINKNEEKAVSEIIKAVLLLHGSHTEDNFECVSSISYSKKENLKNGPEKQQGIILNKSGTLLSELVSDMANLDKIPKKIKKKYPEMTQQDYWGALHAVALIISAFEWNSTDAIAEQDKDSKREDKLVASSIRQLRYYQENGLD